MIGIGVATGASDGTTVGACPSDAQEASSFQYRIAELYEKRLEDVPRSIELYRDILAQQPDHAPTLQALEGLKAGDKDPLGAAAVLEPVYEAASDWLKLVSVHEVQVAHTQDVFQKVELLHRIARLYEDAMDNHASAFDTYARAVVLDNGNQDTLSNLERLATVVNRWPDVAALYDAGPALGIALGDCASGPTGGGAVKLNALEKDRLALGGTVPM